MNAPEIRLAAASDVPAIHRIECASFGDPWSERSFRSLLAQHAARFTVADRGGTPIGYCIAIVAGDEAELANLAVAPEARRDGVGRALLDDLLASIGSRCTVYLEVRAANLAAQGLYASRGFVVSGRRKGYYAAPVEDAIMMKRPSGPMRDEG